MVSGACTKCFLKKLAGGGGSGASPSYLVCVERAAPIGSYEVVRLGVWKALDVVAKGLILEGKKVLLKPNVCAPVAWDTGAVTNPLVVKAVAEWMFERGASKVDVGEDPIIGVNLSKAYELSGLAEVSRELGVGLLHLASEGAVRIEVPRGEVLKDIEVSSLLSRYDLWVSIPVMKTHILTTVTLGLKNTKGVLPAKSKRKMHFIGLDQAIADLYTVIKPDFVVLDATLCMEGSGPVNGTPKEVGLVLASRDPLPLDVVASWAMGFEPEKVAHIAYAAKHAGLAPSVESVSVTGYWPLPKRLGFEPPPTAKVLSRSGVDVIYGDACSGCVAVVEITLRRLEQSGELGEVLRRLGGLTIAIGPRAKLDKARGKLFVVGKCLYAHREKGVYVPGCPPIGFQMLDAIRAEAGLEHVFPLEEALKEADELYSFLQTAKKSAT